MVTSAIESMSWTNSGPDGAPVLGRTIPRLWTPPLRDLDDPDASYGHDVVEFAEAIGMPLDPWQQWLAVHLGELLPDGRPRFRTALVLVARQNGKTTLCKVLVLYWLFVDAPGAILGTSTDRSYAKIAWSDVIDMAKRDQWMAAQLGPRAVRLTLGEEELVTLDGASYRFAANNGRAGRSLTLRRWLCDELREHRNTEAWASATNAMNAVRDAQTICITNQGDNRSVVLDALREPALAYIETGQGDSRLGLFEWSSPPGSSPTDLDALAWANPNLGHRVDSDALVGAGLRAELAAGQELADYRTEVMCQRVHLLDPAVDPDSWAACGTDAPIDMAEHRDRVALCVDVSLDGQHATVAAATVIDGVTHVEIVRAWSGHTARAALRDELPALVTQVRPATVGWFPQGPAAAVAAQIKTKSGTRGWAPRRTVVAELTADTPAVCMGLAEVVQSGQLCHPRDELLTNHVQNAQKLPRGDAWTFTRRGSTPIDAAYAAAGAVHLARTMPPPRPKLRMV